MIPEQGKFTNKVKINYTEPSKFEDMIPLINVKKGVTFKVNGENKLKN